MEFRILGPLEVEENGRSLAPGGRRARALLAVLLIHANQPVSADRLVDEVWGDELPENAAKSLQIHVSRLRKALGNERLRTSAGGGYALVVEPDELDRDRAEELVRRGRHELDARDADAAASAFAEALALFRGRPLEEFAAEAFAHAEIARLEELRLAAAEGHADAKLALGHGPSIVGELESLVAMHPLRERLREQLMIALYQAGRQADALAVYADTRRRFADELGLEPGPSIRELERRVLNHDPALAARAGAALRPRRRPTRGISRRLAAAAVMVAVVAVGVAAWASGSDTKLPERSVGVLDPETLDLKATVSLPETPSDIAVSRRAIFAGIPGRRSVVALDPGSLATAVLGTAVRPARLAAGSEGVWLLETRTRRVALLGSDRVYTIGEAPGRGTTSMDAFAAAAGSVWLAERDAELVFRLVLRTGRSTQIDNGGRDSFFEGDARRAVAIGAGSVWASNPVSDFSGTDRLGRVSRIDLRTGKVTARIRLPAPPIAIAADEGAVWVGLDRGQTLWRIDPHDQVAAAAVAVGSAISDLAVGEGAVWALSRDGTVSRIDPSTNSVTSRVQLGRGRAIAAGHGAVWVAAP